MQIKTSSTCGASISYQFPKYRYVCSLHINFCFRDFFQEVVSCWTHQSLIEHCRFRRPLSSSNWGGGRPQIQFTITKTCKNHSKHTIQNSRKKNGWHNGTLTELVQTMYVFLMQPFLFCMNYFLGVASPSLFPSTSSTNG